MFLDSNGLIVQSNGDGGDTAQRTGFYFLAYSIDKALNLNTITLPQGITPFEQAVKLLMPNGQLVRNPIGYNDPSDTSRDQTRPMMMACGVNNMTYTVEQLKPKGFPAKYPNGDIASPENMNEYRRSISKSPTFLGDMWAYGDAFTRCSQAQKDPDDVGDTLNTLATLVFFYLRMPTSESISAMSLLLRRLPTNYGVMDLGEKDPVMGALAWYFRSASGGNTEIAEAWRGIIKYVRKQLNCEI